MLPLRQRRRAGWRLFNVVAVFALISAEVCSRLLLSSPHPFALEMDEEKETLWVLKMGGGAGDRVWEGRDCDRARGTEERRNEGARRWGHSGLGLGSCGKGFRGRFTTDSRGSLPRLRSPRTWGNKYRKPPLKWRGEDAAGARTQWPPLAACRPVASRKIITGYFLFKAATLQPSVSRRRSRGRIQVSRHSKDSLAITLALLQGGRPRRWCGSQPPALSLRGPPGLLGLKPAAQEGGGGGGVWEVLQGPQLVTAGRLHPTHIPSRVLSPPLGWAPPWGGCRGRGGGPTHFAAAAGVEKRGQCSVSNKKKFFFEPLA